MDDWEIEKHNLTILDKKLGGGHFGVVKEGEYKTKENDNLVVAVKMLKGVFFCALNAKREEPIENLSFDFWSLSIYFNLQIT